MVYLGFFWWEFGFFRWLVKVLKEFWKRLGREDKNEVLYLLFGYIVLIKVCKYMVNVENWFEVGGIYNC